MRCMEAYLTNTSLSTLNSANSTLLIRIIKLKSVKEQAVSMTWIPNRNGKGPNILGVDVVLGPYIQIYIHSKFYHYNN